MKVNVKRSATGLGLFATEPIKRGEFVIEYTGNKISNKEADEHPNRYLFSLNSRFTIDGSTRTNIARYINHSCLPNCTAYIESGKRIVIHATRAILAGEEFTYDYGSEYFDEYIKPTGCKCPKCTQVRVHTPKKTTKQVAKVSAKKLLQKNKRVLL